MLIETFNLTKKYGKKLALNKVNLKINRGQLVAYLGTNGAGKTTTIGKLAKRFKDEGKSVILAAADTFRAGAVEQLVYRC